MEFSSLNILGQFGSPANNLCNEPTIQNNSVSHDPTNTITTINDWIFEDDCHLLKPFQELDEIQEVWSPPQEDLNLGETQNLIDEVEEFLTFHEKSPSSSMNSSSSSPSSNITTNEELSLASETQVAEEILDALIRGNVSLEDDEEPMEQEEEEQQLVLKPTGNGSVLIDTTNFTNVSEFVLEDGRNVIIMIADAAPPQPAAAEEEEHDVIDGLVSSPTSPTVMTSSPSPSSSSSSDDSEWSPSSPSTCSSPSSRRSTPPKAALKSKRSSKLTVIDKKERKKWQNVEAARRYRDKKKVEQVENDFEINLLLDKNKALKDNFNNMQNEVKTLKKLMTELGLIKTTSKAI